MFDEVTRPFPNGIRSLGPTLGKHQVPHRRSAHRIKTAQQLICPFVYNPDGSKQPLASMQAKEAAKECRNSIGFTF